MRLVGFAIILTEFKEQDKESRNSWDFPRESENTLRESVENSKKVQAELSSVFLLN
jgi:hypothetical protein